MPRIYASIFSKFWCLNIGRTCIIYLKSRGQFGFYSVVFFLKLLVYFLILGYQ